MYNTKKEIENWLNEMNIKNYVINENLTVDVQGNVCFYKINLKGFPIKFGVINGDFNCSNNKLTSLEGCPEVINSSFYCSGNDLTSLEYCPEVINGDFFCINNKLTDFKYFPKEIKEKYNSFIAIYFNNIKEEELVNFNCEIENVEKIYSDFNKNGDKEEFLEKVNYYKNIKKENKLFKMLNKLLKR